MRQSPHPSRVISMSTLSKMILLVEDNEDDEFALNRAIRKAGIDIPVRVVTDGQQAIDFLSSKTSLATTEQDPLPFLILLDLKLPYRNGFEVLEWIRSQPHLADISIVILTGSDEACDRQRAQALGARSYLVKPASPDDIKRLLDLVSLSGLSGRSQDSGDERSFFPC